MPEKSQQKEHERVKMNEIECRQSFETFISCFRAKLATD